MASGRGRSRRRAAFCGVRRVIAALHLPSLFVECGESEGRTPPRPIRQEPICNARPVHSFKSRLHPVLSLCLRVSLPFEKPCGLFEGCGCAFPPLDTVTHLINDPDRTLPLPVRRNRAQILLHT